MNKKEELKIKHDALITIAFGKSRKDTNWKNKEMLWSEFVGRLSKTTRTHETVAEYRKMSKDQQSELKDVGGFVGGVLKGGRRKADAVVWRQVLTLDADFVKGDLWAGITALIDFSCLVYSTHKHTPELPRLRLVVPLLRPVTPEEYVAIGRRIAADFGIDMFDDTTFEVHRLMYFSSTPADGEFVFHTQDGPWLDPDAVLARYPDWRDQSYYPESSRVKNILKRAATKQGDPLEKPGLIGAFCRTYSVEEAIETFLPDIYEACGEGRYTYLEGSTAGGLVIYDSGKFVYSHHGTDLISGQLVNAFDLVRIHKFGIKDSEAAPGTPVVKLPSYLAMQDFCLKDNETKRTLGTERLAGAQEDFADVADDWLVGLELNKRGEVVESLPNMVQVLRHDPTVTGLAYNNFHGAIMMMDKMPWRAPKDNKGPLWTDADDSSLRVYMSTVYKMYSPAKLADALSTVAHERGFHPVNEFLEGLEAWDGEERLDSLLVNYLAAEDTPYVRAVTRKTLVAAVARVMRPGCKFDCMLVLNGGQGIGKSTLFKKLGGKWFNDSLSMVDAKDKTAAEKLQGYWILEIGELAGLKKADLEAVKSFLSRQKDIYRPSYGRRTEEHPRQCIIVGSTNNDLGFLRDTTGNRRFWPVRVSKVEPLQAAWNMTGYTIEQIWAEALKRFKDGEALFLSPALENEAIKQQNLALECDERLGMIENYLNKLLPVGWEDMELGNRRAWVHGTDFGDGPEGTVLRDRVCVSEIWCELFNKDLGSIKRHESDDLHGLIRQLPEWERFTGNPDGKMRFNLYGIQRAYVKKNVADSF